MPSKTGTQTYAVADLNWISGIWFGTCQTRECELIWGRPINGVMQGSYIVHESGVPISTGRLQMNQVRDTIIFSVKPLELDLGPLGGVTDAATFRLVELSANHAKFYSKEDEPYDTIEICRTGDSLKSHFNESSRVEAATDVFDFKLIAEL